MKTDGDVQHPEVIPPQQKRSRASLAKLMQAAKDALAENGAADFTMADVAARAGVSVGGIYRRFEGRDVLLRAVKDEVFSDLERRISAAIQTADPDLTAVTTALIGTLVDDLTSTHRLYPALLAVSPTDPVMADRGTTFLDRVYAAYRDRMKEITPLAADPVRLRFAFQVGVGLPLRRASVQGPPSEASDIEWRELRAQTVIATVGYLRNPESGTTAGADDTKEDHK